MDGADRQRDLAVSAGTERLRLIRARFVELHARLLAGEPAVVDELCVLIIPELRRQIRPRDRRIAPEFVEEAIDETLTQLVTRPTRCDPERGDPIAWLMTIARNKLNDVERGARCRWRREVPLTEELESVLEAPTEPSNDVDDRRTRTESHRRQVLAVAKTDPERRFLEARLLGAPVIEQAAALGAVGLSEVEQRALVNRVWQRLHRRLLRSAAARRPGRPA